MRNGNKWAVLTSLALLFSQQFAMGQLQNPEQWAAGRYAEHPLTGRIWSAALQDFITPNEFPAKIKEARYLLLGEKHDNPDHHTLQLAVVREMIQAQRIQAITFEMMDSAVVERLLDLYLQEAMTLAELETYLLWDSDGWDWDFYGPLMEAAYRAGVPLRAGNITSDRVSSIYAAEADSVNQILDETAISRLRLDIDESHCGMLPESQFPAMVRVQQARDRALARNLQPPEANKTSVLIAGNYHVRRDLGVPNYLQVREPSMANEEIVALAFLEVEPEENDPSAYQQQFSEQQAYDYIWFTPAVGNEDYCASMQQ